MNLILIDKMNKETIVVKSGSISYFRDGYMTTLFENKDGVYSLNPNEYIRFCIVPV